MENRERITRTSQRYRKKERNGERARWKEEKSGRTRGGYRRFLQYTEEKLTEEKEIKRQRK